MNILLQLFYRFLQGLVWVSFKLYFRRIVFINKERLSFKGPMLVISNHPNTLMDPLVALYRVSEQCFLLANYSLFKHPVSNAILSTLYCIPIRRVNDVTEGEPLRNEEAFRRCDEHLIAGGNIYIAVEGNSFPERRIREIKTGVSRIAFSAEIQKDFELNLRILPIVMTYFEPLKFWQDVRVEVGEPISVDSWREAYMQNPRQTITDLTDAIEKKMIDMTIHCQSAKEDNFLKKIEKLLQSDNNLNVEEHYQRSRKVLQYLHNWQGRDITSYEHFQQEVRQYFTTLNALKIADVNTQNSTNRLPLSIIKIIGGFPIFLYGFIANFAPAWVSDKLVKWLKFDVSYDTTVRYTAGLILFPLFWWLQFRFLVPLLPFSFSGWLYLLTVAPAGLIAYGVYTEGVYLYHFFKYKRADKKNRLTQMRQPIIEKLNYLLVS